MNEIDRILRARGHVRGRKVDFLWMDFCPFCGRLLGGEDL